MQPTYRASGVLLGLINTLDKQIEARCGVGLALVRRSWRGSEREGSAHVVATEASGMSTSAKVMPKVPTAATSAMFSPT